jgi:hypothetical protein
MKLRIRGNLLRFRLGKSEVQALGQTGKIEETLKFVGGQGDFSYSLETVSANDFSGSFASGKITVRVPELLVDQWVNCEEVGIEGSQTLDDHTELNFLIEKDFVCLNAHNDEDQSDRYPHPNGDAAC